MSNFPANSQGNQNGNQTVVVIQNQSQVGPAICAFLFGGIGQLIQGRVLAGLLWLFLEWFICLPMVLISAILIVGPLLTGPLWFVTHILCVIDAALYKPETGKKLGGILKFILWFNGILLLLFILGAVCAGLAG